MTTRERIARVIHAADRTHRHEPWAEVAEFYLPMAQAVLDDMMKSMAEFAAAPSMEVKE